MVIITISTIVIAMIMLPILGITQCFCLAIGVQPKLDCFLTPEEVEISLKIVWAMISEL